jgi:aspartyl protease/uncharacterized protein DUF4124
MIRARLLAAALLLVPALAASAGLAWAQMYRWTDDGGGVHYSQGLDSVPTRHRGGAQLLAYPESPAPAPTTAAPPAAPKVTKIPFTPGKPIMVSARINGGGSAQLMLDTGASVTVINPRILAGLGVSNREALRGSVRGVAGSANVLFVPLQSIEVGSAKSGPLRVASHDIDFGGLSDGLLGRDFLDQFTVNIDSTAGFVTLSPK